MKQGLAMVSQCISFTRLSSVWVWRSPEIYMSQVSIVLDQSAEASNSAHQASGCHCDLDEGHGNWWKEFKRCVGFECMVLQRSSLSMLSFKCFLFLRQRHLNLMHAEALSSWLMPNDMLPARPAHAGCVHQQLPMGLARSYWGNFQACPRRSNNDECFWLFLCIRLYATKDPKDLQWRLCFH